MSGAVEASAFDDRYLAEPDPWDYETSAYEREKYERTLASLPARWGAGLEMGCSNGELTSRLADRCDSLVAFDFSAEAVRLARAKTAYLSGVRIERRDLRGGIPSGPWDVIIASEVLYYLPRVDVEAVGDAVLTALAPGGSFLAVHWLGEDPAAPLDGGEVHQLLRERLDSVLRRADTERHPQYVLDRWERTQRA
jgi:SAM-dependent methyltransferase